MIYAVLADIHANSESLERILRDAESEGAKKLICLGDIVGYGPRPRECVRLVRDNAAVVLAGNHDDAVSGRIDADAFIDLAREAVERHRAELSADDLKWLRSLAHQGELNGEIAFAHADIINPKVYNYIDTKEDAAANFAAGNFKVLFVGHTHQPMVHVLGANGAIEAFSAQDFTVRENCRYIVNVGSVGYPRSSDGHCESTYVIYDSTMKTIRFRSLPFSVASMLQRGGVEKRKFTGVAIIATALLMTIGAFIGAHQWKSAKEEIVELKVDAAKLDLPVVAKEMIYFTPSKRKVRANLTLERKSAAARLSVSFEDTHQAIIKTEHVTLTSTSRKAWTIPKGAISARFEVRPVEADGNVAVKRLTPQAE